MSTRSSAPYMGVAAEPDAGEQVGPDLAENCAHLLARELDPLTPGEPLVDAARSAAARGRFEHERLDVALEPHSAEHGAGG